MKMVTMTWSETGRLGGSFRRPPGERVNAGRKFGKFSSLTRLRNATNRPHIAPLLASHHPPLENPL